MTIKFLHTPIEQIDQLCRDEEKVKVTIAVYNTEHYNNNDDGGSSMLVKTCEWGQTIKSSKDLIQFDDSDMKKLSRETKHKLR